mmetsp:Transcript_6026/g.7368  ORF Transcript_6026/g.7368 Transcript_6026/m.7368 type:complete len:258 (+) Transcript_6026:92-865(+)|eukprot:jgi/Bigna1/92042/estExt_fgenesh1_pg.C_2120003
MNEGFGRMSNPESLRPAWELPETIEEYRSRLGARFSPWPRLWLLNKHNIKSGVYGRLRAETASSVLNESGSQLAPERKFFKFECFYYTKSIISWHGFTFSIHGEAFEGRGGRTVWVRIKNNYFNRMEDCSIIFALTLAAIWCISSFVFVIYILGILISPEDILHIEEPIRFWGTLLALAVSFLLVWALFLLPIWPLLAYCINANFSNFHHGLATTTKYVLPALKLPRHYYDRVHRFEQLLSEGDVVSRRKTLKSHEL